jgi:hypothetical protein
MTCFVCRTSYIFPRSIVENENEMYETFVFQSKTKNPLYLSPLCFIINQIKGNNQSKQPDKVLYVDNEVYTSLVTLTRQD